jgi:hypothetical protein
MLLHEQEDIGREFLLINMFVSCFLYERLERSKDPKIQELKMMGCMWRQAKTDICILPAEVIKLSSLIV